MASMLALLAFSIAAFSQKNNVKGVVVDDQNEPLMGVTVMEKGTTNGVVTDIDGNYAISVEKGATLRFTYMGYADQEIAVGARREINVTMREDTEMLDELVVIGYGVQRKSDITGSIASINGKDINDIPVASALQALQGRAAGVKRCSRQ